jgi:hypothetical protein
MRVYIGPYKNWIGPWQVANWLKYLGFSEKTCDKVADWLPLKPFETMSSFRKRKVKVKIHNYDTWSMDHTLSLIVLPMLKQLQETKHGTPFIEDSDVPEELRSTNAGPKENEWDTDEFHHDRWIYVLNEMIFAFESQVTDWEDKYSGSGEEYQFNSEGYIAEAHRIANGFRLFGTYFQALWD